MRGGVVRRVLRVCSAGVLAALTGCSLLPVGSDGSKPHLVVGSFQFSQSRPSAYGWALPWSWSEAGESFSESQILAELYAQVLRDTGYDVDVRTVARQQDVEPALERGELDVIPAYAASMLEDLDGGAGLASADVDETWRQLQAQLSPRGLAALKPSRAIDTNGFAVRKDVARRLHLRTMSDLEPHAPDMVLGAPPECPQRPFCLLGLQRVYGLHFKGFKALDIGKRTKSALRSGDIDVGEVLTTDTADFDRLGLVLLEDDGPLQQADVVTPVVNGRSLHPPVRQALDAVSERLTTQELSAMNDEISRGRSSPSRVARRWLEKAGLL